MFEITPEEQLRVNGYIVYNRCEALNFPEREVMICDIAEIDDVVEAIKLIGRYFEKERGFIHIDTFMQQVNRINSKYPKVAYINTTSRNMLYPKLAERCKSDINKFIEGKFKQQRAERYIDDSMKQWEQRKYTQQVRASASLQTDEAIKYMENARKLGLIDNNGQWLKGLQMLACFAREMSVRLKLGKGERISWQPFEKYFGIEKGKLRLNYNDIQKTGQSPTEVYLIDKVFE